MVVLLDKKPEEPERKSEVVGGLLAEYVQHGRAIVEDGIARGLYSDTFCMFVFGRIPGVDAPLTETEILGFLYHAVLDQYGPRIAQGRNRAQRRAGSKQAKRNRDR